MNNKLRIMLSLILALTLVMGGVASAASMVFYDVTDKVVYYDDMTKMQEDQLVQAVIDNHMIAKVAKGGKLVNYADYKAAAVEAFLEATELGMNEDDALDYMVAKLPAIEAALTAVVVVTEALTVESVSAINATTVNVVLDKDASANLEAVNKANYSIDQNMQVESAKLLSDNKTVQLTTSTQIEGKTYSLTVKKAALNSAADVVKTFAASAVPVVVETTPNVANLTNLDATSGLKDVIKVKFNKAMDENTINSSTVKLFNATDGVFVQPETYGVIYNADTKEVIFDAKNSEFKTDRKYILTVSSAVKALDGTALGQDYKLEFSTGLQGPVSQMVAPFPAGISDTVPTPNMMTDTVMSVRFLKGLMASDVNTDNVKLFETVENGSTRTGSPVAITVNYDESTKTLSAKSVEPLKEGTRYRLYITNGLRNSLGNYSNQSLKDELVKTDVFFETTDQTSGKVLKAEVLQTEDSATPVEFVGTVHNVKSLSTFVLKFDKEVKAGANLAAVKVLDEDGNNVSTVTKSVQAQEKTLTLVANSLLPGKKYSISIDGLVDVKDNEFSAKTYNFTVGTGPVLDSSNIYYENAPNSIVVLGANKLIENGTIYVKYTPEVSVAASGPTPAQIDELDKNSVKSNKFKLVEVATDLEVATTVSWDYSKEKVAVNPVGNLKSNTDYKLVVSEGAMSAVTGNKSVGTANEATFNLKTGDHVGPTIEKIEATVNKAKVAIAADGIVDNKATAVTITFDEPIAAGQTATVVLKDLTQSKNLVITSKVQAADNKSITIDLTQQTDTDAQRLVKGNMYQLEVSKTLVDQAGNFLNQAFSVNPLQGPNDYTLRFTLETDKKAPMVEKVTKNTLNGTEIESGATGLAKENKIVIRLDKKLIASQASATPGEGLGSANVRLIDKETGLNVLTNAQLEAAVKGITTTTGNEYSYIEVALNNLTKDGKYELTLMGLKDQSNPANVMADYKFEFSVDETKTVILDANATTDSYIFTADFNNDGILDPAVDTKASVTDATGVLVNSPIYIKLNEAVTGLNATNVTLAKADGTAVEGTVTVDGDNKGFTFKPSANFAYSTVFKLTIAKDVIVDEAGNKLANNITKQFKTAAAPVASELKIASITPSTDVFNKANPDTSILIKFNQDISASSVTGSAITLNGISTGFTTEVDGDTVIIRPDSVLTPNTNVTVATTTAIKSKNGSLSALVETKTIHVANKNNTTVEGSLGINEAKYLNGVLTLSFDRVVDEATAKNIANYTIQGGNIVPLGNGIVSADGLTVTFVCDKDTTVIVPGTTTLATNTTVLYEISTGTNAFGTVAVKIN